MGSKCTPAMAYLDDLFLCNVRDTHGAPPREQWLAAAEATRIAMLVSYFCGYFLSVKKYDGCPSTLQKYLGIWCDSKMATFRIPKEKLDKVHARSRAALGERSISFVSLQSVVRQCMSMSVVVRPASLSTQAMFSTSLGIPAQISSAKWSNGFALSPPRTEGPGNGPATSRLDWSAAPRYTSSPGRGEVIYAAGGPFRAGRGFPRS